MMARGSRRMSKGGSRRAWNKNAGKRHVKNEPTRKRGGRRM